jgi:hypothetical protein
MNGKEFALAEFPSRENILRKVRCSMLIIIIIIIVNEWVILDVYTTRTN